MKQPPYEWGRPIRLYNPDGHRLFQSLKDKPPESEWAVADNSGSLPHLTEDGVLWVNDQEPLFLFPTDHGIRVEVPVFKTPLERYTVRMHASAVFVLKRHVRGDWPIKLARSLSTLVTLIEHEASRAMHDLVAE